MSNAQTLVLQQGDVFCWVSIEHTEMNLDWITQQIAMQHQEHGAARLALVGYDSPWKNKHYDKPNKIAVQLRVLSVQGDHRDFTYTAQRTVGLSNGDKGAARGQEPEWFEIHVKRLPVLNQPKKEKIAATWRRVPQPV